jgi:hypothetical protein
MKKIFVALIISSVFINYSIAQKGYTEVNFVKNLQGGLPGTIISDVDFDTNGDTWISFGRKFPLASVQGYGIAKWDGSDVTSYNSNSSALNTNAVYSIAVTDFYVCVGTDKGLIALPKSGNLQSGKVYDSLLSQKGLGTHVIGIKKDGDFLWLCSDNGLGKLNITTDDFIYYGGNLWGKPNAKVYTFEKGENGDVWLGTDGGVVKMAANSTFTVYDKTNSALVCDSVYSLHWQSAKKELWIGSDGADKNDITYFGMYVLRTGKVYPVEEVSDCGFKALDRYPARIFNIEETSNGEIVASLGFDYDVYARKKPAFITINGNYKISKYFLYSQSLNPNAGIKEVSTSIYTPMFVKNMPNGKLWLGTFDNKAFAIDDISKIANDNDNIGQLTGGNPQKLDINQVSALVLNNGDMFWDLIGQSKYEVPKNTCKSPIFASSIWMGGLDNDKKIHTAVMTYRDNGYDFFPGPLDTTNASSPLNGDSSYLKIWSISNWEVQDFKAHYADGSLANGSYTPPDDFITWPAHGKGNYSNNLAPFVDIDNNGLYEPLKGDYPKIKGEQTLYWIFNDAGNTHSESQGLPLGVEVHAMAYAYNCDSIAAGSPNEALNYTTFYEYKIINRSAEKYDSTYFGVWTDVDLGFYGDDYVGCNPQNNFAFGYNADNDDEGALGYGKNPPMISTVFLSDAMTNFMTYSNDYSIDGNPTSSLHYYYYLKSRFKNDSGMVVPVGPNMGMPTNFALSGIPYTAGEWNEAEVGNVKGDRRFLQSTGPYNFEPGGVKTFGYAIVYSREPNKPNGLNTSWAKNLNDVKTIKNWYTNQNFPTCATKPVGLGTPQPTLQQGTIKLYPNPTNGQTNVEFNLNGASHVCLSVYNILGETVFQVQDKLEEGSQRLTADLTNQPAGIYIYTLSVDGSVVNGKIIKTE